MASVAACSQQVDVCTGNAINDLTVSDSCDLLSAPCLVPIVRHQAIMEGVGSGFPLRGHLNRANDQVELLLAHLLLQIGEGLLHDAHVCLL